MKKLIVSTVVALLLLTALTRIAFATPAVAEKQLLFRGSLQAVENDDEWRTTSY